jgi:NAD-dependent dihydropyrimidine dehydrogenase PreA subunit
MQGVLRYLRLFVEQQAGFCGVLEEAVYEEHARQNISARSAESSGICEHGEPEGDRHEECSGSGICMSIAGKLLQECGVQA